jgi:hypothetical protein
MAAPRNIIIAIEQRGVVRFLWAKNMDAAKDIRKEMLPVWAAFLCGYPLLHPYFLPTKNAQRHTVLSWYMYSGALTIFKTMLKMVHPHLYWLRNRPKLLSNQKY